MMDWNRQRDNKTSRTSEKANVKILKRRQNLTTAVEKAMGMRNRLET